MGSSEIQQHIAQNRWQALDNQFLNQSGNVTENIPKIEAVLHALGRARNEHLVHKSLISLSSAMLEAVYPLKHSAFVAKILSKETISRYHNSLVDIIYLKW